MKRITANNRLKQWKFQLKRIDLAPPPPLMESGVSASSSRKRKRSRDDDSTAIRTYSDDPFDCSELIIPNSTQLVKEVMKEHIEAWEELDSRIVVQDENSIQGDGNRIRLEDGDINSESDGDCEPKHGRTKNEIGGDYAALNWWGWNTNRIRLPDFFDYRCKGQPPKSSSTLSSRPLSSRSLSSRNANGRQVISLQDPTIKLDYDAELWKIFQKVPSEYEIESKAAEGSILRHIADVNEEIDTRLKEYTRLDGHALSRMRKKERHHWPRVRIGGVGKERFKQADCDCATIRMEFWRRHPKRYGCDPNKCEVEFVSTQTLLDVHNLIVECSEDELFQKGKELQQKHTSASNSRLASTISGSSGYFFIEDTFYTTGDVDYVTTVLDWLDEDLTTNEGSATNASRPTKSKRRQPIFDKCRRRHLRIAKDAELKKVEMRDVKLGDVDISLARRYVHVYNGDCETAVFFTDVSVRMKDENVKRDHYPLLHDIWTTASSSLVHGSGVCQGCNYRQASMLTLEDELTDGGPTVLCSICYAKLHYNCTEDGTANDDPGHDTDSQGKSEPQLRYNNFRALPLSVLQNLKDLSVGHDLNDTLF